MTSVNRLETLIEAGDSERFQSALAASLSENEAEDDAGAVLDACAAHAIRSHQPMILSHLLSLPYGSSITSSPHSQTYFAAAEHGDPSTLDQLLAAGFVPVDEPGKHTGNWLGAVVEYGNLVALKHIFSLSAYQHLSLKDIVPDPSYNVLTGVACGRGDAVGTLRFLLDLGARSEVKSSLALHAAAGHGTLDVMSALVDEAGADVNEMPAAQDLRQELRTLWQDSNNDRNGTPLHWAAGARKIDSVRWLLDRGADPSRLDSRGRTILQRSELLGKPPDKVWGELKDELEKRKKTNAKI